MTDEKVTTIQIDTETRDKLKMLGEAYERSAAGQLRWMVSQDYEKLLQVKAMVASVIPSTTKKSATTKRIKSNEQPQSQSQPQPQQ